MSKENSTVGIVGWVKYSKETPKSDGEYQCRYWANSLHSHRLFETLEFKERMFQTEHDEYFVLEWLDTTPVYADQLIEIKQWSNQYEFSFQFWGRGNNNVFINKGGVELVSFGGENSIEDILKVALKWCNDKNPKGVKEVKKIHRCGSCGTPIAAGNDFCGECLCEDDSE